MKKLLFVLGLLTMSLNQVQAMEGPAQPPADAAKPGCSCKKGLQVVVNVAHQVLEMKLSDGTTLGSALWNGAAHGIASLLHISPAYIEEIKQLCTAQGPQQINVASELFQALTQQGFHNMLMSNGQPIIGADGIINDQGKEALQKIIGAIPQSRGRVAAPKNQEQMLKKISDMHGKMVQTIATNITADELATQVSE